MILFLSPKYMHFGVINSQVLMLAKHSAKSEKKVVLIYGTPQDIDSLLDQSENNIEIVFYKEFKEIKSYLRKANKIYLRHYTFLTRILLFKKLFNNNLHIVYDFRALLYKESWFRKKRVLNSLVLYLIEWEAYMFSNSLCCISYALKFELTKSFGSRRHIHVMPCATETAVKKENVVGKPLKFVYSGSMHPWQKFQESLKLYKILSKQLQTELTVFTTEKEKAISYLKEEGVVCQEISSLRQDEVKCRLKEFDFGFLIRDNLFINRVASPIKFLEYVSSGVIPIVTPWIGDFSNDVEKHKLGYIYKEGVNFDELQELINDQDIHNRLFEYSKTNTWEILIKNHPISN